MEPINRYSRHELLAGVGPEGQAKIRSSAVLIIGAGGLGSAAALYLGAAGVGRLTIADGDSVDLTNLQRQIIHNSARVGIPKALSAKITLQELNPEVRVAGLMVRPGKDLLEKLVASHDVVLDCTDNSESRRLLSEVCRQERKPLVTAGVVAFYGQATVFDYRDPDSACYACVFPNFDGSDEKASTKGVFSPLVGMLGCIEAGEALKIMGGFGEPLTGRLLMVDGLTMQCQQLRYSKDDDCPVCGLGRE